jgi:hypothetical protein
VTPETLFAVVTGQGSDWDLGKTMREQIGWNEHAGFMNRLADNGVIVLAGTLGDDSKALLVIRAANEVMVRHILSQDPWTHLRPIELLQPWHLAIGELPER